MGECLVRSFPHGKSSAFTRDRDLKVCSVAERKAHYDSFFKKKCAVDDSDERNSGSLNDKKSKISSFSTLSTKGAVYKCVKNSDAKTQLKATFEAKENTSPNIQGNSSQLQLVIESSLRWRHCIKWSAFTRDRQMEEVKRYCKPGLVVEIKAYLEAQFKKRRAAALHEQQNVVAKDGEFKEVYEGSGDDIVSKKEDKAAFNEGNSYLPYWTSWRQHCVIWSAFTRDRHMEEVKRCCKLGSVDEKKAYFEAQFKKRRAAALLEQQNVVAKDGEFEDVSEPLIAHEKTIVPVTHQLEFLDASDLVLAAAANQIEATEINFVDISRSNEALERSPFEVMETSRVKWHVYATAAYRGALVSIILLCQMLFQTRNYWIAWGSDRVTNEHLIKIFTLCSFFILGRLSIITIKTAQRLFHGMITRASLSFFESTPSSRIPNWSSTDQSIVDTDNPCRLAGLAFVLTKLLSIVVLMWQVPCQIFFPFLIVFAISDSIWYQEHYISTARELARMVPAQHAPILHRFSESISRASIIRSFCQEDGFSVNLGDDYPRVFNLVFFLLLVIILVSLPRLDIVPSLASWVIWNFCNVENKMIPSETPLLIEDSKTRPDWPDQGSVDIENDHILQNIENEI